jgi:hypothetical protein
MTRRSWNNHPRLENPSEFEDRETSEIAGMETYTAKTRSN